MPSRCRAARTYYLSSLIQASRSSDEFAGVLAHELGHVYYRHGMQTLIATSTTGLLVGFVLGDMTGLSVAAAIGASLIDNRFSRASRSGRPMNSQARRRSGSASSVGARRPARSRGQGRCVLACPGAVLQPPADRRPPPAPRGARYSRSERLKPAFTAAEWQAIRDMCPAAASAAAASDRSPRLRPQLMRILIRTSKWAVWARRFGALALPLALIPVLLHRGRLITQREFRRSSRPPPWACRCSRWPWRWSPSSGCGSRATRAGAVPRLAFVFGVICLLPAAYLRLAGDHASAASPDVSTDFANPPPLVSFVESRFVGPDERAADRGRLSQCPLAQLPDRGAADVRRRSRR